ncbi:RHS repeat domain-containing protein [Coprobacter tertius]|uniref:DUF6443 domain-containing protein n=1 Tax=Coprobacter tertius TaxID=2944915 RepID=A0ABT1MJW3_9BACT|nr:DUF6443 domain-containing protein [Coprobacter tertius]MCP9612907.1 DUF6443 domain-containing protein [Coprobacter tertius]
MKMRKIAVFAFMLAELYAYGQEENIRLNLPDKMLPSPDAASIAKYQNYPVDHCTGVPDISIPLYEIVCGDLRLPITLSYHASGLRVHDISGLVGLGWSLNAEPQITRSVNVMPDEKGYLINGNLFSNEPGLDCAYYKDLANGNKEEEPDDFYYRLADKSGSFIIKRELGASAVPMTIPYDPVKIDLSGFTNEHYNMTIQDENGVLYEFGDSPLQRYVAEFREITDMKGGMATTCWKASRMISPHTSDTVYFHYQEGQNTHQRSLYDMITVEDSIDQSTAFGVLECATAHYPYVKYMTSGYVAGYNLQKDGSLQRSCENSSAFDVGYESNVTAHYPEEIRFRGGRVVFSLEKSGTSRPTLQYITVYDNNGNQIRRIRLNHTTFLPGGNDRDYKRRLDSVEFLDARGNVIETYSFDYWGNTLPYDLSTKDVDFWGYYNGEGLTSSQNAVKRTAINCQVEAPTLEDIQGVIGDAERGSNETAMKCGVLTKITYPSGGYTSIHYEANRYQDKTASGADTVRLCGGLRVERIVNVGSDNLGHANRIYVRRYTYGVNGCGTGYVKSKMGLNEYMSECRHTYTNMDNGQRVFFTRLRSYMSNPVNDILFSGGSPIIYEQVREDAYDDADTASMVRKIFTYRHRDPLEDQSGDLYIPETNIRINPRNHWRDGLLLKEEEYKTVVSRNGNNRVTVDFRLEREIEHTYAEYHSGLARARRIFNKVSPFGPSSDKFKYFVNDFSLKLYNIETGIMLETKKVTTIHDGTKKNVTTEVYDYTHADLITPTKVTTTYGDGTKIVDTRTYLTSNSLLVPKVVREKLYEGNRLNILLKRLSTITSRSGWSRTWEEENHTYAMFSDGEAREQSISLKSRDKGFDKLNMVEYNIDGRPQYMTLNDHQKVFYLWGYRSQYVVAEIQGVTAEEVKAKITQAQIDALAGKDTLLPQDITMLNNLRNSLPQSRIVSRIYKPLVGVKEETAPDQTKYGYEYDAYYRLLAKYQVNPVGGAKEIREHYRYYIQPGGSYVVRSTPFQIVTSPSQVNSNNSFEEYTYFDPLGRPEETVQRKMGGNGEDLITYTTLDYRDRPLRSWLTYAGNQTTGAFVAVNLVESAARSFYNDTAPYRETVYENSSDGRPVEETGEGQDWRSGSSGKKVRYDYYLNDASGDMSCYDMALKRGGVNVDMTKKYPAGSLFVTKITDEDGHVVYEFHNGLGQKILERKMNGSEASDTYFTYERQNRPEAVLPPESSVKYAGTQFDCSMEKDIHLFSELPDSFPYGYPTMVRTPGSETSLLYYDKYYRVIQELLPDNRCLFKLYDDQDRLVVEGECDDIVNDYGRDKSVETKYNPSDNWEGTGYSTTFSGTNIKLHNVYYYDTYDYLELPSITGVPNSSLLSYESKSGYGDRYATSNGQGAKGRLTGEITYRLEVSANQYSRITSHYYDYRGNEVQRREISPLSRQSDYYAYDYLGQVTRHYSYHSGSGITYIETEENTYNSQKRLSKSNCLWENQRTNTSGQVSIFYDYDRLGRVSRKRISENGTPVDTIGYDYTIRGWVQGIRGRYFKERLVYQDVNDASSCFNGNIRQQIFQILKPGYEQEHFYYEYDGLNRLYNAWSSFYGPNKDGQFGEQYEFDRNSNITHLYRYWPQPSGGGTQQIDNLSLSYNAQTGLLSGISESIADQTRNGLIEYKQNGKTSHGIGYDNSGREIWNEGMQVSSVSYNVLSLPRQVQTRRGDITEYEYNGRGEKTGVTYRTVKTNMTVPYGSAVTPAAGTTTSTYMFYEGNKVYMGGGVNLRFVYHDDYYYDAESGKNYYYSKNHLGSICVVTDKEGNLQQANRYYPSGLPMSNSVNPEFQTKKLSGKEFDQMHNMNLYDHGARMYNPVLLRWTTPDPLAYKYLGISPYIYCAGNPVCLVDLDGKEVWGGFDFFRGVGDAIGRNMSMGSWKGNPSTVANASAYNGGQLVGDVLSAIGGVGEMFIGGATAIAGGAITVGSAGTASVVGGGAAVAGAAVATHGATMINNAVKSVVKGEGRIDAANGSGTSSKYENVTKSSRGKSSTTNIKTDVTKKEFGKNLENSGYKKTLSKDGKADIYTKGDKKYSVRDYNSSDHNGPTADYAEKNKVKKEIRLEK